MNNNGIVEWERSACPSFPYTGITHKSCSKVAPKRENTSIKRCWEGPRTRENIYMNIFIQNTSICTKTVGEKFIDVVLFSQIDYTNKVTIQNKQLAATKELLSVHLPSR